MDKNEYEKVSGLTYREYCAYLRDKYGLSPCPYMSKLWYRNSKCSRTKDGLICHHVFEDHAIMLSTPVYAQQNPYTWQLPENLVYCDYLEHLLLHIMICENPPADKNPFEAVGVGGVLNFIVPELNDYYSGFRSNQPRRQRCYDQVKDDIETYFLLLKRFKRTCNELPQFEKKCLYTSFNEDFGYWSRRKNRKLFRKIARL